MSSNSILIGDAQHMKYLNKIGVDLTELRFEPRMFSSNTILNDKLFKKLKLIGRDKFNNLTITLTFIC
jgi:hypothetical protein